MSFYLINVEQLIKNNEIEDTIILYLHKTDYTEKKKIAIKVKNIHCPLLIHFQDQKNLELKKEQIKNILNRINLNENIRFKVSIVSKTNYFHQNLPEFSKYIQIYFYELKTPILNILIRNMKKLQDGFAIIKDFDNPVEQFFITTEIKIPCIINIDESNIKNINGEFIINDYKTIKFLSYNLYENPFNLKLKTAGIIKEGEKIYIGISDTTKSKPNIYYNFNDIQSMKQILNNENVDLIIHHNLKDNFLKTINIPGLLFINTFSATQNTFKLKYYSIDEILNINTESDDEIDTICRIFEILNKTNFLELSIHVAQICGGSFNKTLNCNRQKRIENLILSDMYKNNMILPPILNSITQKYQGGLVLEPIKGYHENYTLLLDFNSLYPTIISEFNVCFSTIGWWKFKYENELNEDELNILGERSKITKKGLLPKILESLINERSNVKKLYIETKSNYLNIKQKALKLTANSIYGCLGFKNCRFYNSFMAKFITAMGRNLLIKTINNLPDIKNIRVIYGDTDSMMIDTGLCNNIEINEVKNISNQIVNHINKRHEKLQIECENIFKILILYTKKKYAALTYLDKGVSNLETKGLDTTRSDYCLKSTNFLSKILYWIMLDIKNEKNLKNLFEKNYLNFSYELFLKQINNQKNQDNILIINAIKNEIKEFKKELYNENYNLDEFICTKKLGKHLNDYDNNLDFVKYCKKLINYNIIYNKDDVIEFIYIKNETNKLTEMYHPKIFKNLPNRDLFLDIDYYLKEQILPALCRILNFTLTQEEIYKCFDLRVSNKQIREDLLIENNILNKFETPCCKKIQYLNRNCNYCNNLISDIDLINFFIFSLKNIINEMYSIPENLIIEYCFNCNSKQNYSFLFKNCLLCGVNLQNYEKYLIYCSKNNWFLNEFFNLIKSENIRLSINNEIFNNYIDNVLSMSKFLIINLKTCFPPDFLP